MSGLRRLFVLALVLTTAACGSTEDHQTNNGSSSSSGSANGLENTQIVDEQHTPCYSSGVVESEHDGFNGQGYLNTENRTGVAIRWSTQIPEEVTVEIKIRYAHGAQSPRPSELVLNSQKTLAGFNFAASNWDAWQTETNRFTLPAGTQTLELIATSDGGLPNIDEITVSGSSVTAGDCASSQSLSDINVWIAGDSTVANGQTPCPAGWGKFFQEVFNEQVTVHNYAAGGGSVRTWMYEVQDQMESNGECRVNTQSNGEPVLQSRWRNMLDNMQSGDYLLIQFGINDGSRTCPRHVGGQAFIDSYVHMAEEAKKRGVNPIFITPVSAIRCSGSTAVATRGFINETLEAAHLADVPFIDLHQGSIDLYNEREFCPVVNNDASAATTQPGPIGDFFCHDHTHFDNPGARVMAERVLQLLEGKGSPLADYVKE